MKVVKYHMIQLERVSLLLALSLFVIVPLGDEASAAPSVSFDAATYYLSSGQVGGSSVIVTVTDSAANTDPGAIDTITINVTSDTDPSGITLTLNETGINTGIFKNSNLIFMEANWQFTIDQTVTISVDDSSQDVTGGIDSTSVTVVSDSDGTGITITLDETAGSSGIFEGTLQFTTASSSGNSIKVAQGDIVSVFYAVSSETSNALIIPNPDSSVGAIRATVGDTITATYQSVSDTATIGSAGGGGGGGGISRAGLVVDSVAGLNGGGCSRDCTPPTLGVTQQGTRLVTDGFSYNDNPIDAQLYYTHYPLIKVKVGEKNTAVLKIFEDGGIDNIRHVEVGFGLGKGEVISKSKAVINYDISFDGSTSIDVFDPEDALDDVSVETRAVSCTDQSKTQCLEVTFYHMFRAPLDFNMVGTNTWDSKRNGWQNYFNHGIEITGDSMNPPKTMAVFDRVGHPHTIALVDKQHGIDESGLQWYMDNGIWYQETVRLIRDDPITSHGIDRNNNKFMQYLHEQQKIASNTFDAIVKYKPVKNPDFGKNYNSPIISHHVSRADDTLLQQSIQMEMDRARQLVLDTWPELAQ